MRFRAFRNTETRLEAINTQESPRSDPSFHAFQIGCPIIDGPFQQVQAQSQKHGRRVLVFERRSQRGLARLIRVLACASVEDLKALNEGAFPRAAVSSEPGVAFVLERSGVVDIVEGDP